MMAASVVRRGTIDVPLFADDARRAGNPIQELASIGRAAQFAADCVQKTCSRDQCDVIRCRSCNHVRWKLYQLPDAPGFRWLAPEGVHYKDSMKRVAGFLLWD